jgi:uracil-DNA glycosylase family 4
MATHGEGRKKILIVSSHPGKVEDQHGIALLGNAGKELKRVMNGIGIDVTRDCWLENALICYPGDNFKDEQIEYCRPNIIKRIKELKPVVVIPIGGPAITSVIGWLYKEHPGAAGLWLGSRIPSQAINAWVCPTYNPTQVLKDRDDKKPMTSMFFEQHLQQAVELCEERPCDVVPDWKKDIDLITEVDEAARILRKMIAKGGTVAIDYECNMLKPEHKLSRIVTCAVCWEGKKTIAFPWHGEAIVAVEELCKSSLGKIAANMKFEDRWSRRVSSTRMNNWIFDTMLAAHVIDNRPGNKSLKFQAFTQLGMAIYNAHIEPFFHSESSMTPNNIDQIALNDLLLYNGLDALLEYKLAKIQMERIGIPFPERVSK